MKTKLAAIVVLAAVGAGAVFMALGGLGTGSPRRHRLVAAGDGR